MSHKLVWLYHYGVYPEEDIAHRSGDTHDNRIENLKLTTASASQLRRKVAKNNETGYTGVNYSAAQDKWYATIGIAGKRIHLGYYNTPEKASEVYEEKKKEAIKEIENVRGTTASSSS